MSQYYSTAIIVLLLISSIISWTSSFTLRNVSSLNLRQRISSQAGQIRNLSSNVRQRISTNRLDENERSTEENQSTATRDQTSVVVLTSLSGIYVWWPEIFGGDDSFHLLLTQEDVPRFHDVTGDNQGNIYLTAPHERTVYRLKYSDGWWISTFSNHSVMNSIRSEMPLFLNIHHVSSMLYVYGHSDIQIIDLLEQPHARGSAPFMKRLRELSPSLRISDMIIDQITSDGYIIGDTYGWCTVIRCSLTVNECQFLFKIPSSYDNRPYPCTATIDFSNKIIYLSLEEKILAVHLNELTHYDRRFILTEKRGPRSTLGYDDIVVYNQAILYTDVLRPLLHICTPTNSNPCLNVSLAFPPPQRTILPLRLSIVQVTNLQPPEFKDEDGIELHINQTTTVPIPSSSIVSNTTVPMQLLTDDRTSKKSSVNKEESISSIWTFILGICLGLLLAGISFMIYYIICYENRPRIKTDPSSKFARELVSVHRPLISKDDEGQGSPPIFLPVNDQSPIYSNDSSNGSLSEATVLTTSSSSYRPDTIL